MIDKTAVLVYNIYVAISEDIAGYMQTYRSGHNGADSKRMGLFYGFVMRFGVLSSLVRRGFAFS